MKSEIEYTCNNCGHEGINTRVVPEGVHTAHIPVPDVPELDVKAYLLKSGKVVQFREGWLHDDTFPLALHSQAAEIIAAKDKEVDRLKEVLRKAHASFENDRTGKFKTCKMKLTKPFQKRNQND